MGRATLPHSRNNRPGRHDGPTGSLVRCRAGGPPWPPWNGKRTIRRLPATMRHNTANPAPSNTRRQDTRQAIQAALALSDAKSHSAKKLRCAIISAAAPIQSTVVGRVWICGAFAAEPPARRKRTVAFRSAPRAYGVRAGQREPPSTTHRAAIMTATVRLWVVHVLGGVDAQLLRHQDRDLAEQLQRQYVVDVI